MKPSDFFDLKINQEIYKEGVKRKIKQLCISGAERTSIRFEMEMLEEWKDICDQCSLEPPKQKEKYWLWVIKDGKGHLFATTSLYNDDGYSVNGHCFDEREDWHKIKKKKIESIFWEE